MMSRKRTFDGQIKSKDDQVYVPFKTRIPAGHCKFKVNVPERYEKQDFFFSSLLLVPDFYSTEAALEELTNLEENNTPINYEIAFKAFFVSKPSLFPEKFEMPTNVTTTQDLIAKINAFFEAHKPAACKHLGAFFDWTDLRYSKESGMSWDDFVAEMAQIYYEEPFDKSKFFNALPVSARSIPDCNNYLFPTHINEESRLYLRLRLFLAPNIDSVFSTGGPLECMGFSASQIGERSGKNQLVMSNKGVAGFETTVAAHSLEDDVKKTSLFKMSLQVHSSSYMSDPIVVSVTKGNSFKNASYLPVLQVGLEMLAQQSNLKLEVSYNSQAKKFRFTFPTHDTLVKATLLVPTDLAERLGFGMVTDISEENKEGERAEDEFDVTKTETRSRALGYDTGMIVVSYEGTRSIAMAGIFEQYMCSLYPTATGAYEMSPLENNFTPIAMELPQFHNSANALVPVTFKLSRFLDDERLVDLDWKNGAFVSGLLRGIKTHAID